MLKIFQQESIYLKIYPNKIEITNLQTDETISKNSLSNFSSSRMLIADFNIAQDLSRSILTELRLHRKSLKVLAQQMKKLEGGLLESEKRLLRDLSEQIGGVLYTIIEHDRILKNDEAIEILKTL
jgi:hypothetical protein